ncbi:MAG: hypothetical protein E7272_12730 [Pseudobutyrivibrio ruminis]|uniref:Uncharacterized protein n=1 Tax=Pseudobutyrivibrio ruminis TaxID=46206 RepID=A0A927UE65_9FIRM|nr:hypothetical protein [Pseudobutyrivibrio ruminis]
MGIYERKWSDTKQNIKDVLAMAGALIIAALLLFCCYKIAAGFSNLDISDAGKERVCFGLYFVPQIMLALIWTFSSKDKTYIKCSLMEVLNLIVYYICTLISVRAVNIIFEGKNIIKTYSPTGYLINFIIAVVSGGAILVTFFRAIVTTKETYSMYKNQKLYEQSRMKPGVMYILCKHHLTTVLIGKNDNSLEHLKEDKYSDYKLIERMELPMLQDGFFALETLYRNYDLKHMDYRYDNAFIVTPYKFERIIKTEKADKIAA